MKRMRHVLRRIAGVVALFILSAQPGLANEAILTLEDLQRLPGGQWVAQGLDVPAPEPNTPLVDPAISTPAANQLRSLATRGLAHGFEGILYDNRDRQHSALKQTEFPALTHLRYGPELRAQEADYGLAGAIFLPGIVLGNSSTALTGGPMARSQSRLAMTHGQGPALSARLYYTNHLYLYPEHRDYDAEDLYPAHWPYHVITQGSSRSDLPFLRALAATLAAFRTETRDAMEAAGLVAPTLQMILRRNLTFVRSQEAYYAGTAYRPALASESLQPERMIAHANALRPDDLPPAVVLRVEEESFSEAAGLAGLSEKLFTTPGAVARIWRSFAAEQHVIVSVAETKDPNGRPLKFVWQLLQGRQDRVAITPLDPTGTRARITLRWHAPFELTQQPGTQGAKRQTSRVDIGVFAENGRSASAPAVISVSFPAHQNRAYGPVRGTERLLRIDYDALGRNASFDPILHWSAPWVDAARYDASGTLMGWQRSYSAADRDTALVPLRPEVPRYQLNRSAGRPILSDLGPQAP